jgi:hypothetical protein
MYTKILPCNIQAPSSSQQPVRPGNLKGHLHGRQDISPTDSRVIYHLMVRPGHAIDLEYRTKPECPAYRVSQTDHIEPGPADEAGDSCAGPRQSCVMSPRGTMWLFGALAIGVSTVHACIDLDCAGMLGRHRVCFPPTRSSGPRPRWSGIIH